MPLSRYVYRSQDHPVEGHVLQLDGEGPEVRTGIIWHGAIVPPMSMNLAVELRYHCGFVELLHGLRISTS